MPRSPRPGALPPALLAGLVLILAVATLLPVSSASAAPTRPASRAVGTITGWSDAPTSVRAGSSYAARVRVSGGSRPVQLQRRTGGAWRTVATTRSSSTGLALLRWTVPRSGSRVVLRVLAPRSGSRAALVSLSKSVSLAALVGSVLGTLTPVLKDVLTLVNRARRSGYTCGGTRYPAVPALTSHVRLSRAAQKFARLMATEDFFSHDAPDGSDPGDRITAEGYRWRAWGENIAAGQRTAADVVGAWLASPGHCTNLMSRSFTEIGLGYVNVPGSRWGTYWVQDFGAR